MEQRQNEIRQSNDITKNRGMNQIKVMVIQLMHGKGFSQCQIGALVFSQRKIFISGKQPKDKKQNKNWHPGVSVASKKTVPEFVEFCAQNVSFIIFHKKFFQIWPLLLLFPQINFDLYQNFSINILKVAGFLSKSIFKGLTGNQNAQT